MIEIMNCINRILTSEDDKQKAQNLFEIIIFCIKNMPDMEKIDLDKSQKAINQIGAMVKYYNQISLEQLEKKQTDFSNSINHSLKLKKELSIKVAKLKNELDIENNNLDEIKEQIDILITLDKLNGKLKLKSGALKTLSNKLSIYNSLSEKYATLDDDLTKCKGLIDKLEDNISKIIVEKQTAEDRIREVINEV